MKWNYSLGNHGTNLKFQFNDTSLQTCAKICFQRKLQLQFLPLETLTACFDHGEILRYSLPPFKLDKDEYDFVGVANRGSNSVLHG